MKKGTTIESGYDASGRWCLKLRKAKGKFTLDEIAQYYDDDLDGDCVTLYRATDFISKECS